MKLIKGFKDLSIRVKLLFAYLLLVLIPTLTLGISMSAINTQNVITTAKNNMTNNSEILANGLETIFENENSNLSLLINDFGYNQQLSDNLPKLADNDRAAEENIRTAIYGSNGNTGDSISGTIDYFKTSDNALFTIRIYTPYVTTQTFNVLDPITENEQEIYNYCKTNTGTNYWSYNGTNIHAYRALVSFGASNVEDIDVIGMIGLELKPEFIAAPLSSSTFLDNGYYFVDTKGNVISHRVIANETIEKEMTEGLSNFTSSEYSDGTEFSNNRFVSKKTLFNNWVVFSYIDYESISGNIVANRTLALSITAISFIITTILAFFASKYITSKIVKLKKGAEAIANGDYAYQIEEETKDEIGMVSSSFNIMAAKVRKTLQDMIDTQDNISESFAEILESKSGQSGHHVKRVAEYSAILAREMGYNEQDVHDISIASMLHDVGKIMVPNSILDKPGRLTDEEYAIMKQHVAYGEAMLKGVKGNIMQMGATIAGCHHERWDGKGYVKGLKGDQIPRIAQLVSVADVFDALVSLRSYKPPWSFDDAKNEIVRCSGTQFSPEAVRAFEKTFDQLVEVAKMYPDGHQEETKPE